MRETMLQPASDSRISPAALALVLAAAATAPAFAAEPRLVWERTIAAEPGQITSNPSLVALDDGTVVFMAQISSRRDHRGDEPGGDVLLVAFAPDGAEAWRGHFAWGVAGQGTRLVRAAAHAGGAITLAGLRASGPAGNFVLAVARRLPSGRIAYDETPPAGSGASHLLKRIERVMALSDGGAIVYGGEFSIAGEGPGWFVRLDAEGRLVSRGQIGRLSPADSAASQGQAQIWGAWPEADGGVTAFVEIQGQGRAIRRFDRAGAVASERRSPAAPDLEIRCAAPLPGRMLAAVLSGEPPRIVWIGADGRVVRQQFIAEKTVLDCWCEPSPGGGLVLAVEFGPVLRFGADGALLWSAPFSRDWGKFTTVEAVAALRDGGAAVAGVAEGSGTTEESKAWRIARYARP